MVLWETVGLLVGHGGSLLDLRLKLFGNCIALDPNALRNVGGMLSGPGGPFIPIEAQTSGGCVFRIEGVGFALVQIKSNFLV